MSKESKSKETDSTSKSPGRRRDLTIGAVDPDTGKSFEVILSHDRLHRVCSRSRGQIKEAKFLVPEILQKPTVIYEGLRKEEDHRYTKTEGWLCYSGVPSCAYAQNGSRIEPRPGEVFLVFVDDEKIVYLWYWCECDKDNPNIPVDADIRFRARKLG